MKRKRTHWRSASAWGPCCLPAPLLRSTEIWARGKTVFVRGIASALGISEVTSPTFTIVQEYDSSPRLLHFDAYRLSDEDELYAIGFDDYLRQDAIVVMEWAELVAGAIPTKRFEIRIEGEGAGIRRIAVSALDAACEEVLEQL